MNLYADKNKAIGEKSPMLFGHFLEHFHRQIYGRRVRPGEPYICANAGTGTIEEMSDWVEYCNLGNEGKIHRLDFQTPKRNGCAVAWVCPFGRDGVLPVPAGRGTDQRISFLVYRQ